MSRVTAPPPESVALTAFRELPDGRGRQYTEAWRPENPYQGCEHFVRMCGALGYVTDSTAPSPAYALLDAVDEDGGILETWNIPTRQAFEFVYRKLHLRVVSTDGDD